MLNADMQLYSFLWCALGAVVCFVLVGALLGSAADYTNEADPRRTSALSLAGILAVFGIGLLIASYLKF